MLAVSAELRRFLYKTQKMFVSCFDGPKVRLSVQVSNICALSILTEPEAIVFRLDHAASYRYPFCIRLMADVHHFDPAGFIQMCQSLVHVHGIIVSNSQLKQCNVRYCFLTANEIHEVYLRYNLSFSTSG